MRTRRFIALMLWMMVAGASAQQLEFPLAATDDAQLAAAMPVLARQVLAVYRDDNTDRYLDNLFRIQLVAGEPAASVATLDQWRAQHAEANSAEPLDLSLGLQLYVRALALQSAHQFSFDDAFRKVFRELLAQYDDRAAYDAAWNLGTSPVAYRRRLLPALEQQEGKTAIDLSEAVQLIRLWAGYESARRFFSLIEPLTEEDETRRYIIEPNVLIRTKHGATLSAVIARSRRGGKQPTALMTLIQTSLPFALQNARFAASRGYAGVVSDTRGKRLSPDPIVLYEKDAEDTWGVIDWISKQPWSDGQVGMYGGSNAGFTQWAAAKTLHPALRTIVPYCPLDPGFGLPMRNNIFITGNYDVFFHLANTKELDSNFDGRTRYLPMLDKWYQSGGPYRQIDQVDGIPNKWLQKFLEHPAYDRYWQNMTANGKDYRKLDIPILAIDGYFDDGQNNAVRRLQEHYRARPAAEHYLVIGPYDHFDAQASRKAPVLRGYAIDPVAQLDTPALTFQWFDHVLKGGPKPAILKDRINYQVMGANVWRSAPSIEAMGTEKLTLHLSATHSGGYYALTPGQPESSGFVTQRVDFADRTTTSIYAYPETILSEKPDFKDALLFISEPFATDVSVDGLFSAKLRVIFNKKDMDVAMVLYEVTPSGQFFHLSWTIQRASFAQDTTRRQLLRPDRPQTIPLNNTLLVSRQLHKGSRLLVALTVSRNTKAQINYGTGKDVSDESVADAREPLVVQWLDESTVTIPISR